MVASGHLSIMRIADIFRFSKLIHYNDQPDVSGFGRQNDYNVF